MVKYPDIGDGWVKVVKRGFRLKCCHCHLIHDIDFRVHDGDIEIRVESNDRATKASRRGVYKKVIIVDY